MDMPEMSVEVAAADTAAEVAVEAAAADPANRTSKRSADTCIQCRARKVRCDGRRDLCNNCERLGFACSFQDPNMGADGDSPFSLSLPRRRVRLACANCHSRKARCSGETPKCQRCQSQGIECVYKPTKRAAGVGPDSVGHGTPESEHDSVGSEPPEKRMKFHPGGSSGDHANARGEHGHVESNGHPASTPSAVPFTFPDESLISRTFDKFFRHVHHVPMLSFLHRASLMQRYHAGMMDKQLILALVGITTLFMDLGPGVREYGALCIDECQRTIMADIDNPSTIKIQVLLLIMKHRMLSRRFTGAFMLAAIAVRFAYALRLNYENTNLCFLARESRRRLMWALCTIDSGMNGGYPDFTLLPTESMYLQLPCNERNFEFDLPQVTEHLQPPADIPFSDDIGSLALHTRLLWIRSRILYCTKKVLVMPEKELSQLPKLVEVLGQELQSFANRLPHSFKFSENNLRLRAYSPRLCVFVMIHIWWRQCHSDLYRIVFSGLKEALPKSSVSRLDPQFVAYCHRQAYEHATATADIFRMILDLDAGLPVTDLDLPVCAYQCAKMLYYTYQTHGRDYQMSADRVQETAHRCLQMTKSMHHTPAGAAIHSDLEELISRGLSRNTTPNELESPSANRNGVINHQLLSQFPTMHRMDTMDEAELALPSPSAQRPSISALASFAASPLSHHTPAPQVPATVPAPLAVFSPLAANVSRPNLPPVDPPEGLDNNNAFEGAMDGFDFAFESFGNTGMESMPWFGNEWLSNEFAPTAT